MAWNATQELRKVERQNQAKTNQAIFCRFLPAIGRFLIVVTFLEDALRIVTQWSDQLHYLQDFRGSKSAPLPREAPCLLELDSSR